VNELNHIIVPLFGQTFSLECSCDGASVRSIERILTLCNCFLVLFQCDTESEGERVS